jgi:hypothetical protein
MTSPPDGSGTAVLSTMVHYTTTLGHDLTNDTTTVQGTALASVKAKAGPSCWAKTLVGPCLGHGYSFSSGRASPARHVLGPTRAAVPHRAVP